MKTANDKSQLSSITTTSKNSPALAPPVFSSMTAEPIMENLLLPGKTHHQQGVRLCVPPPTPPSLHSPLVSSEFNTSGATTDTVALSAARFTEQHWDTHTGRANRV
ncbi:hypothetical protein PBY51_022263 [Eleginops maclovinus]|uniref:Uncharacterized protein n=1 Tax=Eleginops maclovinus TaxID=56733 RepID=A0AAN7XGP7_ELEMC|nr:hypothetical protein PBY51_022263 [Eleginops maclovinus]